MREMCPVCVTSHAAAAQSLLPCLPAMRGKESDSINKRVWHTVVGERGIEAQVEVESTVALQAGSHSGCPLLLLWGWEVCVCAEMEGNQTRVQSARR